MKSTQNHIDQHRNLARISYLEKTIGRMQNEHADTLVALHKEIERLTMALAELQIEYAKEIDKPPIIEYVKVSAEIPKIETADKETQFIMLNENICCQTDPIVPPPCLACIQRKSIIFATKEMQTIPIVTKPTEFTHLQQLTKTELPNEAAKSESTAMLFNQDASLYFLVQKERVKFKALVQRTIEEKKYRKSHIERLNSKINLMSKVLQMAGIEFDQQEFEKLVEPKNIPPQTPIKILTTSDLNTKNIVLPPIARIDSDKNNANIYELESDTPISEKQEKDAKLPNKIETGIADQSDVMSEITAIAPQLPKSLAKPNSRADRLIQKISTPKMDLLPAIALHNQNLDYNNRAKMYLDDLVYESQNTIQGEAVAVAETLPVLKEVDDKNKSQRLKSMFSQRVWRVRKVRQKYRQDLFDQI